MKPGVREININAWAPRLDVDNRISLHFYYRIADNLLKQASIYREEKNLIDLYIILLRFSSLLCDTIPSHRDYRTLCLKERSTFKKKLLDVINELEALKPVVHREVDERNRGQIASLGGYERNSYPSTATQTSNKAVSQTSWKYNNGHSQLVSTGQTQISKQIQKSYLNLPYPKEETLSRHSILGPGGLGGHYSGPITGIRVQYPSNADITTENFRIPLTNQINTGIDKGSEQTAYSSEMASVLSLDDGRWSHSSEPSSVSVELMPDDFNLLNIKQPSPPPVLAHVHPQQATVPIPSSKIADPRPGPARTSNVEMPDANTYQHLHIPVQMMEYFLRLAEKNTAKNLETCGILAGSLKERRFCVTTLIIPKQEATSDSCQTTNEEEIFDYQDRRSLFPLGWIHTHPSQTCFMSSVDLHTHYSYQIMLPEAIAIVMAPTDETRKHGIFHLSDPGGVSVIRNCQERGFHPHEEPSDGSPLYEHCSHVYLNPNLKFELLTYGDSARATSNPVIGITLLFSVFILINISLSYMCTHTHLPSKGNGQGLGL